MRKYLGLGAAAALGLVTAFTAVPAANADAVAVLTTGSAGGANVTNGDTLQAGLTSGTTSSFLDANGKGVTCTTANFAASVTDNPAAPGVASESITALGFSGCTSNISGVKSVKSITIDNLPYAATVDDSTDSITISSSVHATISLGLVIGSATCKYSGPSTGVTGSVSLTDGSLSFVNQTFTRDTGSWAGCPSPESFNADFGPVLDTSVAGSPSVFLN
ncbi:MAG TPA: hypothetical protein VFU74_12800 [Actinocrinis sp.]|nr:hypothetical protein [Actinocrinis sp.]